MSSWEQFVDLVLKGDYFIVFIAVLMVIIMSIILYLVKLQINSVYDKEDNTSDKKTKEPSAPRIVQIVDNKETVEDKPIFVQSKFNFNEDELVNDKFVVTDDILEKTQELKNLAENISEVENKEYAHIEKYEEEQEASAIISYDELHKRKDEIEKGIYTIDDDAIENYEEEQEKKAIISYDELLEKASSTVLTYQDENIPGIKISKVDTMDKNNPVPPKKPYYYEEEFLRALKEFRASL